ncbi:MAG: hypothetical protein BWZ02_03048 [Lentisphaerae bacterium ADurb.BinA184]|nr:MAG: hypothetical protein BWZ02_03048 [Lentisphaerae bacterium ADurb.BinA184]
MPVTDASPGATRQEKIDTMLALVPPYWLTCTYTLWNDTHDAALATSSCTVLLPEPAALAALAMGTLLAAGRRPRRPGYRRHQCLREAVERTVRA